MKYWVNKITKEHRIAGDDWADTTHGRVIEADSEGWIKHEGNECPLPEDVKCDIKFSDGESRLDKRPVPYNWRGDSRFIITHYRPILAENVQEPEPVVKDFLTTDLLDRLKAAHEAAQQIPDLEAELRAELGSMGYDLVPRIPFEQQRHGAKGE